MKRTKEWWSRLTPSERSELVTLEGKQHRGGAHWSLPDGWSICLGCNNPHHDIGMCPSCKERIRELRANADGMKR